MILEFYGRERALDYNVSVFLGVYRVTFRKNNVNIPKVNKNNVWIILRTVICSCGAIRRVKTFGPFHMSLFPVEAVR